MDDTTVEVSRPVRELVLVYLLVSGGTFAITRLRDTPAADYVHLMVGALFLLTAMRMAQREPHGMQRHGIALGGVLAADEDDEPTPGPFGSARDLLRALFRSIPAGLKEIGIAVAIAAVVFPPFAVGFALYHGPSHPFVLSPPADLPEFALAQLLVVGLPEEALFRGWFQTRLGDVFAKRRRLLWADVSIPALLIQAALFAVIHFVVDLDPNRLAVFFPGLLFGWLRAQRGGVGAAIVLHAMSNVYADILVKGWLA